MSEDPDWNANRSKHIENLERSLNDRDAELHQQIQLKLEAIRVAEELRSELKSFQKALVEQEKSLAEAQSKVLASEKERDEWKQITANREITLRAETADLVKALTERDEAMEKVHAFESAMEREKKPEWKNYLERLAAVLVSVDSWGNFYPIRQTDRENAAKELRYMADSFTLKANFVPSELRIKELEEQVRLLGDALDKSAIKKADLVEELEAQLTQSEANQAVMREALQYCGCHEHDGPKDESGSHYNDMCEFCKKVDNALANSSGKALLDKVERYEKALEFIRDSDDSSGDAHHSETARKTLEADK
jgi:hypothetical protein